MIHFLLKLSFHPKN